MPVSCSPTVSVSDPIQSLLPKVAKQMQGIETLLHYTTYIHAYLVYNMHIIHKGNKDSIIVICIHYARIYNMYIWYIICI